MNARELKMSPEQLAREQERQRSVSRSRRERIRGKPKGPGKTKAARNREHATETGYLRSLAWERAGGTRRYDEETDEWVCEGTAHDEITGVELGAAWELHHVEGAGLRRSRQRLGNVLAVSWETHRRAHRGDLGVLELIARSPELDDEARRAALRRVAKVHEARQRPSVPVRVEVLP